MLAICTQCRQNPVPSGREGGYCEACKEFNRFLESVHHVAGVYCLTKVPDLEERIRYYGDRAELELPLFDPPYTPTRVRPHDQE